jgi:cytochrome c oxidase subunit 3
MQPINKNTTTSTPEATPTRRMHPQKFALWMFIVSVVMIFASLTSAYIVRMSEGDWVYFELPTIFYYSTTVILLSSVTMHLAYHYASKDNLAALKINLSITAVLGIVFAYMQVVGWGELIKIAIYLVGNPSGSFVYVLTGLHALHVLSAVIVVFFSLVAAFRYKIHSKRMVQIEMCATYWHFLDFLWVYLFVFLLIYR